jgi:hydroxyacylglutathione hydrolase
MEVVLVPAFTDNYIFLGHSAATGETMVVDPGDAGPVLAEADSRGWRITHILNTHWHADHIGGNAAIKAATGATLIGPSENGRIPNLDRTVGEGDTVPFGETQGHVIAVPGHTAGHIAFHFDDPGIAFVGDTLFALGCGRLLEGTADQMYASLAKLMALPDPTFVYCAHEYTLANLAFALTVDPDSPALRQRAEIIRLERAANQPTVPTSIGLERATNPFVRAETVARFAELRAAKDVWRG